ncbi:phosphatase domain-containing protein [Streptomyces sp. NPDC003016]
MCGIDGALALTGDRGTYDSTRCEAGLLNVSVWPAPRSFRRADDVIAPPSGRGEGYRTQTESRLRRHEAPYDEPWMRGAGDGRRDDEVKAGFPTGACVTGTRCGCRWTAATVWSPCGAAWGRPRDRSATAVPGGDERAGVRQSSTSASTTARATRPARSAVQKAGSSTVETK